MLICVCRWGIDCTQLKVYYIVGWEQWRVPANRPAVTRHSAWNSSDSRWNYLSQRLKDAGTTETGTAQVTTTVTTTAAAAAAANTTTTTHTTPCVGPGHPSSPLSIYFIFPPFSYFSLSIIGFTYFLLLSIPSLSTRIVPRHFQAGGHRRRPNLGLVCVLLCNLC